MHHAPASAPRPNSSILTEMQAGFELPGTPSTDTPPSTRRSSSDSSQSHAHKAGLQEVPRTDREHIKMKFQEKLELRKEQNWMQGADAFNDVEVARTAAQDAGELRRQKEALLETVKQTLGIKNVFSPANTCINIQRILPKVMFLFVIVGCELDLYGFMMSLSSYWQLDFLPLRILLVTSPLGFVLSCLMYLWYSYNPEPEPQPDLPRPSAPTANPYKPGTSAQGDGVHRDVEDPMSHMALEMNTTDKKEQVHLKYYHFTPLVRYYLIIKDQNPSDVEGLFRVNSLSSFTLGVAQICGILFASVNGEKFDLFMKINIASQIINWSITFLYFGTSICNRMKASFKVDTLCQNSVTTCRNEYESYLAIVNEAQRTGGRESMKLKLEAYHQALNYEISEFLNQPVNLTVLSMEEKYLLRLAIRKRMHSTYARLN